MGVSSFFISFFLCSLLFTCCELGISAKHYYVVILRRTPDNLSKNGVVSISLGDVKGDEIDDLIVSKKYQGCGYGKKILLWAIANIQASTIVLHVAGWNEKAISLYKKTGFEITETFEL